MKAKRNFTRIWEDMLRLQKELDDHIFDENVITYPALLYVPGRPYAEPYKMAILDELGELNHELKVNWCWWKKSQAPVDRDKVLGELVDVLHFVLSWQIAEPRRVEIPYKAYSLRIVCTILEMAADLSSCVCAPVDQFVMLMNSLGFTIEEVYEAYKAKNAINHQRQNEGY